MIKLKEQRNRKSKDVAANCDKNQPTKLTQKYLWEWLTVEERWVLRNRFLRHRRWRWLAAIVESTYKNMINKKNIDQLTYWIGSSLFIFNKQREKKKITVRDHARKKDEIVVVVASSLPTGITFAWESEWQMFHAGCAVSLSTVHFFTYFIWKKIYIYIIYFKFKGIWYLEKEKP